MAHMYVQHRHNAMSIFNKVHKHIRFLSGFWPRGIKMRCNGIPGGQSGMVLLEAKHMAN